jgi:deoxyadenosine/deoxycytidine kinase
MDYIQFHRMELFGEPTYNQERRKYAFLQGSVIVLEGLIGVGKTTLGLSMQKYLSSLGFSVEWIPENIPKSLLKLYTTDMKKYAFPFQVIVARDRKTILEQAQEMRKSGKIVIIDRCLLGDYTFALMQKRKRFFSNEEFEVYRGLVKTDAPPPDFTIFLSVPPEVAFERMKKRGNSDEINGYTLEYFKELDKSYREVFEWAEHISINWMTSREIIFGITEEGCDFVLNQLRREHMAKF